MISSLRLPSLLFLVAPLTGMTLASVALAQPIAEPEATSEETTNLEDEAYVCTWTSSGQWTADEATTVGTRACDALKQMGVNVVEATFESSNEADARFVVRLQQLGDILAFGLMYESPAGVPHGSRSVLLRSLADVESAARPVAHALLADRPVDPKAQTASLPPRERPASAVQAEQARAASTERRSSPRAVVPRRTVVQRAPAPMGWSGGWYDPWYRPWPHRHWYGGRWHGSGWRYRRSPGVRMGIGVGF